MTFAPTFGSWLGEEVDTWSLKRRTQRTNSLWCLDADRLAM